MTQPNRSKRKSQDENEPFQHYDPNAPKRKRSKVLKELTAEDRAKAKQVWEEAEKKRQEERENEQKAKEEAHREQEERALKDTLNLISGQGFDTLFKFLKSLLTTKERAMSSQVTQMVERHASELLNLVRDRDGTDTTDAWIKTRFEQVVSAEMDKVTQMLRPDRESDVSTILEDFSLDDILKHATNVAPNLQGLVSGLLGYEEGQVTKKKKDVVLAAVLSVLAQCRNEKSSRVQTVTGIFLFACGASKALFDVLNHAGFCLSYTQTLEKLKTLADEQLEEVRKVVRRFPCLIVYDNVNIAFRVGEQRQDSKDHFDNGTTATLVPLFDVLPGTLPLSLLPTRSTRRPTLEFDSSVDFLPTLGQAEELEGCFLYHIEEILLDAYPPLRHRLIQMECPELKPPMVKAIPVHKTEQYPLPAALIDESTIDGTLQVINHIFFDTLKLSDEELKTHGTFFVHGDQLTVALLETTSGSRRDDKKISDNPSKFIKPVMGLFHAKVAGARCLVNHHWGTPNGRGEHGMWKANAVLGRKAVSCGWSAKASSAPSYQVVVELTTHICLPAHILDAWRLVCGEDNLDKWVEKVKVYGDLRKIAKRVLDQYASGHRVERLRAEKVRDPVLENTILFNRDALIFRSLQAAIKRGDIGTVVNVLTYWMVMFRGTGKMPKYADILFATLMATKNMDSKLREDSLKNWLVNLSGHANGFKELDLLQEHHNFWLKVIYAAKGSNKSWKWLSLVSVCLFALRDVIRRVQTAYQTPYNGKRHTSPSIAADVAKLREHLEKQKIQSFHPSRPGNDHVVPVTDLLAAGAAYSSTPAAFENFRSSSVSVNYRKKAQTTIPSTTAAESEDGGSDVELSEDEDQELDSTEGMDFDDLTVDDDDFPGGNRLVDVLKGVLDGIPAHD